MKDAVKTTPWVRVDTVLDQLVGRYGRMMQGSVRHSGLIMMELLKYFTPSDVIKSFSGYYCELLAVLMT